MRADVSVVIPSFNQRTFLEDAIVSVLSSNVAVELIVMDGGSTDGSIDTIKKYEAQLHYWQSKPDGGQSVAVNAGVSLGTAPFVCWINSDDFYLEGGLKRLLNALQRSPNAPFAYGKVWNVTEKGRKANPYITTAFSERLLANYCFISQPGTLIRREAWEAVSGVSESLHYAMDYDLWWKLYRHAGQPIFLREFVAANRMHSETKTHNNVDQHYAEAISVVKRAYGRVPIKWKLLKPLMKSLRYLTKSVRNVKRR